MLKVLLASFQSNTDTIGLKYVHSYLLTNQVDSHILFIPYYDDKVCSSIDNFIKDLKPDIIGITLMSHEFYDVKKFSQYIKDKYPDIVIAWGGIHPTIDPKSCVDYADYVFVGESEEAFYEFVTALQNKEPVDKIKNLAVKSKGTVIINELRPLNDNLDSLPFPGHFPQQSYISHAGKVVKLDMLLFKKYSRYSGKFYSLTTTRGCPFSCAYCCNSYFSMLYGRKKNRKRSSENIIRELKETIELYPGLIYVNIQDDCFFTYDVEWMKKFADIYKNEINLNFICRTTPAHLSEEKLTILKKAGLSWVFMGLQSGSERVNKDIYKRYVSNATFIKAAKLLKDNEVACYYDVILDNPYEEEKDLLETIKVLLNIPRPFIMQLFSLCFYPGTEMYTRAMNDKLDIEDPLRKNYSKFRPTLLNKIIQLSPLVPRKLITFIVNHRDNKSIAMMTNLIYLPARICIEPFIYLRLVLISFNYNIVKTSSMLAAFAKTAVIQRVFKRR